MNTDTISITETDYLRLRSLINNLSDEAEQLDLELDVANIISSDDAPSDLVTMNSKVHYINLTDQREHTIEIVYPRDADIHAGKVSILAPIGTALLGLRQGQSINWKFPDGKTKELRVLGVLYQPEASGDWHL